MIQTNRCSKIWTAWIIIIGLLTPSLIILILEVFVGRIKVPIAIFDVMHRQFAEGHNLFYLALFGLIPFVALSIVCFFLGRRISCSRLSCVAGGGLLGILALMIPSHISVWYPLYSSAHVSSTAVIAFLFIPFYCLVSLIIGLVMGWLASLLPSFRDQAKISSSHKSA